MKSSTQSPRHASRSDLSVFIPAGTGHLKDTLTRSFPTSMDDVAADEKNLASARIMDPSAPSSWSRTVNLRVTPRPDASSTITSTLSPESTLNSGIETLERAAADTSDCGAPSALSYMAMSSTAPHRNADPLPPAPSSLSPMRMSGYHLGGFSDIIDLREGAPFFFITSAPSNHAEKHPFASTEQRRE